MKDQQQMDYFLLAQLLVTVGMEATDFIIRKQQAGAVVRPEEWTELRTLAAKTPQSQLADALARSGLSKDDPHVAAVLAMLPAK